MELQFEDIKEYNQNCFWQIEEGCFHEEQSLIRENDINQEEIMIEGANLILKPHEEESKEVIYERKFENKKFSKDFMEFKNENETPKIEDKMNSPLIIQPSNPLSDINKNSIKESDETNRLELNDGIYLTENIKFLKLPVPEFGVIKNNIFIEIKNNVYEEPIKQIFKVFNVFNYRNKKEVKFKCIRRKIQKYLIHLRKKGNFNDFVLYKYFPLKTIFF